ncbi:hypothetical protein H1C71_031930, partial [Ictidomys tridecemlineatus]
HTHTHTHTHPRARSHSPSHALALGTLPRRGSRSSSSLPPLPGCSALSGRAWGRPARRGSVGNRGRSLAASPGLSSPPRLRRAPTTSSREGPRERQPVAGRAPLCAAPAAAGAGSQRGSLRARERSGEAVRGRATELGLER